MRINSRARPQWDKRCTELMLTNAEGCSNAEMVVLVEQQTGHRFSLHTVSERRSMLGLKCPRSNNWTAALCRWRHLRATMEPNGRESDGRVALLSVAAKRRSDSDPL